MSGLQDPERFLFYLHQINITQYGASGLSTHPYSICNYRMKHCTRRDFESGIIYRNTSQIAVFGFMFENNHARPDLLTNETSDYLQPAQRLEDQPRPLFTKTLVGNVVMCSHRFAMLII